MHLASELLLLHFFWGGGGWMEAEIKFLGKTLNREGQTHRSALKKTLGF